MQNSNCKMAQQNPKINQAILDEIIKSIQQINYGEVVITIHESKIVQVERREKKRFQNK